jgi:hypothetical protein
MHCPPLAEVASFYQRAGGGQRVLQANTGTISTTIDKGSFKQVTTRQRSIDYTAHCHSDFLIKS